MTPEDKKHTAEVLNDLLKINNDRIEGYKKASEETSDPDLQELFSQFQKQSEKLTATLAKHITSLGIAPEIGITTSIGDIYRKWMEVKANFSGNSRKSVLDSCEFGEDAAQTAYETALSDEELPVKINMMIKEQQSELKASHDSIKELRDAVAIA